MSKKKRLFGILLALPPLLLGLLYGGGYIAQFMRNYHEWEAAGGTPGNGTSPTVPSFAVSECLRAIFTMPYGIVGILICVGALVLLIVMVMRMGYSETGEYDKDRNFIYSKKGTYGTSGFMSEKEAEEIFDLRTSLKNHNGTIFGLLNGRYAQQKCGGVRCQRQHENEGLLYQPHFAGDRSEQGRKNGIADHLRPEIRAVRKDQRAAAQDAYR